MTRSLVTLLVWLVGCGPTPPSLSLDAVEEVDTPKVTEAATELLQGGLSCEPSDVRISNVHPWPGGGYQIVLSATAIEPLAVGSTSRTGWPFASHTIDQKTGLTGMVILNSSDPTILSARIEEAATFITALPPEEKVVLWVMEESLHLLADTTYSRSHLLRRLQSIAPKPAVGTGLWVNDLTATLESLGDPFQTLHRSLVLVGGAAIPEPNVLIRPVNICNLAEGLTTCDGGVSYDSSREETLRIGVCPPHPIDSLLVRIGSRLCQVPVPMRLDGFSQTCDPGLAAIDHFPYGKEIRVELTPEQKALYDEYHAAQSQEDFEGTIALGNQEPEAASMHFRGATSMHCDRKSLKVNLAGNSIRRFMAGGSGDEFYLISLCKDERYFNQVFANRLLHDLHQFPLVGRYVRLLVNGKNLGIYYQLEHTKETLLAEHVNLQALVRRRFDPHDKPEDIKFPDDPEGVERAQLAYDALAEIALNEPPESLVEALEQRMDLTRYLRWLAFNTFMRNGDTIDEAFFYASEEAGGLYFRHMGWDADDLFSDCHHYSKYALVDPHELIYCAEGNLDQALLRSPKLYERYVTELEQLLLADLSPQHLEATMAAVEQDMWSILTDDLTAKGLKELHAANPNTVTAQGARQDIRSHMQSMLEEAETRRALLLNRIEAYRSSQ